MARARPLSYVLYPVLYKHQLSILFYIRMTFPLSGFSHIPHLLIKGPSTTHKYSKIYEFLHANTEKKSHVHYVNCAHMDPDSHPAYIQNQIYLFAQIKSTCTRFVVFDHAEFLTLAAQSILRRYIEQFSKNVRFVFILSPGGTHRLIIPILSRLYKVNISDDIDSGEHDSDTHELRTGTEWPKGASIQEQYECIQQAYQSAIPPLIHVPASDALSIDALLEMGDEQFKSDKLKMLFLCSKGRA